MSQDREHLLRSLRTGALWALAALAPFAAAILLASFLWTPGEIAAGAPWALVGLEPAPCPGCAFCGLSRATSAMSHLRVEEAISLNRAVLVQYPVTWAIALAGGLAFARSLRGPQRR